MVDRIPLPSWAERKRLITTAITITQRWIESFVIDLNLCPFAHQVNKSDAIHYTVSDSEAPHEILRALHEEISYLDGDQVAETSFLILTKGMKGFREFNDWLAMGQSLLEMMDWVGTYQLVGFHPHHQFAGTDPKAAENYTNRSPYPMVHILRESSVTRALEAGEDVALITERNTDTLNQLGIERLIERWQDCCTEHLE